MITAWPFTISSGNRSQEPVVTTGPSSIQKWDSLRLRSAVRSSLWCAAKSLKEQGRGYSHKVTPVHIHLSAVLQIAWVTQVIRNIKLALSSMYINLHHLSSVPLLQEEVLGRRLNQISEMTFILKQRNSWHAKLSIQKLTAWRGL
jgi:hypothetical protein